ncbi:carboxyl transferase domain-containing protein [Blastococcus sp. Marseille-P5729]|uniref:acetyl-CoA carboxylase family protein n=1 Tax=Blastococcus sp. Marseille-P5729 TaxID=2086582 RepID=UPI0018FE35C1|nr:carboxyl transferase domain-containing protein [Blastococcus sp. Marseille-P5729]
MGRLLVANRGEIAVRIIESAALMGLQTVAVYPDDDRSTLHVERADESVLVPGAGPAAYLDVEAIIGAATSAGCDLLHPGLGFLSENADLARRCAEEGITFIGPDAEALGLFGDKAAARARAVEAGVPVAQATEGPTTLDQASELMASLGSGAAVMVKAIAGGGGRGMAPVTDPGELSKVFERCAAEAQAAFGSGELYVEQLVQDAHHVEVQIVADRHGAVAAVGDRDCSAQRRRQKLIEIAPAPWISDEVRSRLHDSAERIIDGTGYAGLATVEFLVSGDDIVFLEVNPRIQVEHTVTEEVTGLDLVEVAIRIAYGAHLSEIGVVRSPQPQGFSLQARVNTETLNVDGTVQPGTGRLTRFQPSAGRGVRVDTHGYAGYTVSPRYDSLLAKVIANGATIEAAIARAERALADFEVAGVATNIPVLRAILADPATTAGEVDTAYVDAHLSELLSSASTKQGTVRAEDTADVRAVASIDVPDDAIAVLAPMQAVVVEVDVTEGQIVAAGDEVVVLEAMKMQHVVTAERAGVVRAIAIEVGDVAGEGQALVYLEEVDSSEAATGGQEEVDPDLIRPDLQEAIDRHRPGLDEGRPDAVERWHGKGRRTARENIADLVDEGSFVEYGALTIAAQRRRRSLQDLIERTTGDGIVLGTATIDGMPVAVMSYDYLVLAGTQGLQNHRKTDRFLDVAQRQGLPVVMFAEGGGGRPGDTDHPYVAQLDVPTFRTLASLVGQVPIVCVVSGYCFAGNAALVGCADVVIATEDVSLGMGGPAMIEGGGLGVYAPKDVGPASVQYPNGVIDVLVPDEVTAVARAREAVLLLSRQTGAVKHHDQRVMRHLIPENRLRSYDVRPVLETLVDEGSLLELRRGYGAGIVTAIARIDGIPIGVMANNPHHLGGAIDHDAAEKATRFLTMCQDHQLPVVSLCDTPGFMVGPESEKHATVRKFGAFFVAGARLSTPLVTVVLRKGYGLGAMAMAGGSMHAPVLTVSWPTGEFGGMGLEGAVRLGYRKELEAIADPRERKHRYDELVAEQYERGKALSTAAAFEIDDVIDPADTREVVVRALRASRI